MTEKHTVQLYNNTVEIDFYPNSHQYKMDGKTILGVTSALQVIGKPALVYWAANVTCDYLMDLLNTGATITPQDIETARKQHRTKKEEAAASGTLVHQWAEAYIKGQKPALPDDQAILNGVTAFLGWVNEHNVRFISSERIVYSKRYGYVGTMDAEAEVDGEVCVVDFKTSKGIYNEMLYQTAAYQRAAEEEGSTYTGGRWIARFDKETGQFEAKQFNDLTADFEAFLAAVTLKLRDKQLN